MWEGILVVVLPRFPDGNYGSFYKYSLLLIGFHWEVYSNGISASSGTSRPLSARDLTPITFDDQFMMPKCRIIRIAHNFYDALCVFE